MIGQLINRSQNNNKTLPVFKAWVKPLDSRGMEYQKIFKSSQENFLKNTRVLFMRYELFHLCLAEMVYESTGKPQVDSFILGQISKIHEQLFKVDLKNLANVFENHPNLSNIHDKNKKTSREDNKLLEIQQENLLNTKHEILKSDDFKEKKLTLSFTWRLYRLFPILSWLPKYKNKKYLKNDIVAGVTVGVKLIAQGMVYAKWLDFRLNIGFASYSFNK